MYGWSVLILLVVIGRVGSELCECWFMEVIWLMKIMRGIIVGCLGFDEFVGEFCVKMLVW